MRGLPPPTALAGVLIAQNIRWFPKRDHQAVSHSVGQYVKGRAHTNGIESFWASLRRAHMGTFHKMSPKHLQRYVNEFAAKNNIRHLDTIEQMRHIAFQMAGKRLPYKRLKAPHPDGLSNYAQPGVHDKFVGF